MLNEARTFLRFSFMLQFFCSCFTLVPLTAELSIQLSFFQTDLFSSLPVVHSFYVVEAAAVVLCGQVFFFFLSQACEVYVQCSRQHKLTNRNPFSNELFPMSPMSSLCPTALPDTLPGFSRCSDTAYSVWSSLCSRGQFLDRNLAARMQQ